MLPVHPLDLVPYSRYLYERFAPPNPPLRKCDAFVDLSFVQPHEASPRADVAAPGRRAPSHSPRRQGSPRLWENTALCCVLRFNDDEDPSHRSTLQRSRWLRLAESVPLARAVVLVAQYDPRNRLMRVAVDGATVARHTYDGEGVRTKRLDANGTIHYVGRRYERNIGDGGSLPDVGTTYIEAQLGARTVLLAFRKGGQLTVVGTDHLGGTLATAAGTGGLPVTGRLRYTPYGQGLGASGNFGTDRGFTGQTVDAMAGLYWFASRSYDPSIGRFVQPDSVVPDWTNPQALNRYAYALNNPLRYVDPSGHDPLDGNWRDWWSGNVGAGSAPDWRAESLQLFAIAFPGEWAAAGGWGRFYDEKGQYKAGTLEGLFNGPSETRNWAAMPAALDRLAAAYLPGETGKMVRDVDQLFAGMRSRSESDLRTAVNGGQVHNAVWLRRDATLSDAWTGGDKARPDADANVHHWAWSVGAGYLYGQTAVLMNAGREVGQGLTIGRAGVALDVDMSDVRIGTAGAYMGAWMRDHGTSPADVPALLSQSLPIGRP